MGIHRVLRRLVHGDGDEIRPWVLAAMDNPLRRWIHPPERILRPHVAPGHRVLDLGPGTGVFTIPLARMVGPDGAVLAADIRPSMLDEVARRAADLGLTNLRTHLVARDAAASPAPLGLPPHERFDFVLLFAMFHETRERHALLRDVHAHLAPDGRVLLAEPVGHVPPALFDRELAAAADVGLGVVAEPRIRWTRAVLLRSATA